MSSPARQMANTSFGPSASCLRPLAKAQLKRYRVQATREFVQRMEIAP